MLYINGLDINSIKEIQYLKVIVNINIWSKKEKVIIDIGQAENTDSYFTDENKNEIYFNSDVDIMNFLYERGWEFNMSNAFVNPLNNSPIRYLYFNRIGAPKRN